MKQFSLRARMAAVFGFLILVVALFMVEFFPARMAEQAQAQAELRARTMTQVLASAVAPALEFDDAANAAKVLGWLSSSPDARFAVVLGDNGGRFATWSPERIPEKLPRAASEVHAGLLVTSAPVIGRGGGRGTLYIGQSLDRLVEDRSAARKTVVSATPVERGRRAGELLAAAQSAGPLDPAKLDAGIRYLAAIAGALDGDRARMLGGLATLRDHIAHINRVATMQNGYARSGGVLEQIEAATLIEQAIGLGCADTERHGLEIVRPGPPAG